MNTTKTTTNKVIDVEKFEVGRAYRIRRNGEFYTYDVICVNVTERVVSFMLYNDAQGISDMLILGAEPAFGSSIDDYTIQRLYPKE
jgi:hypothetical protein